MVSFGVAVMPIWVAAEKYSRISRHAESSAALPRWHSSMTIRSKKSRRELVVELLPFLRAGDRLIEAEVDLVRRVDAPLLVDRRDQVDFGAVLSLDHLAAVLSFAIAAPNGLKSLTIVWSTSMLRSARKRIRFLRPAFHRRQMIWNAV